MPTLTNSERYDEKNPAASNDPADHVLDCVRSIAGREVAPSTGADRSSAHLPDCVWILSESGRAYADSADGA